MMTIAERRARLFAEMMGTTTELSRGDHDLRYWDVDTPHGFVTFLEYQCRGEHLTSPVSVHLEPPLDGFKPKDLFHFSDTLRAVLEQLPGEEMEE